MAQVADELGLTVPEGEAHALADALPSWRVFPEVPDALTELRDRGWKLAILSNTDPDLLEASISSIGVEIDERVVASDIGSYKPAFGHWETFFRRTDAERTRHVHVAASLFHDIEPCAKLGLPAVWIDRLRRDEHGAAFRDAPRPHRSARDARPSRPCVGARCGEGGFADPRQPWDLCDRLLRRRRDLGRAGTSTAGGLE